MPVSAKERRPNRLDQLRRRHCLEPHLRDVQARARQAVRAAITSQCSDLHCKFNGPPAPIAEKSAACSQPGPRRACPSRYRLYWACLSPPDRAAARRQPLGRFRVRSRRAFSNSVFRPARGLPPMTDGSVRIAARFLAPQCNLLPDFRPSPVPSRDWRASQKNFMAAGIIVQRTFVLMRRPPELVDHAG